MYACMHVSVHTSINLTYVHSYSTCTEFSIGLVYNHTHYELLPIARTYFDKLCNGLSCTVGEVVTCECVHNNTHSHTDADM